MDVKGSFLRHKKPTSTIAPKRIDEQNLAAHGLLITFQYSWESAGEETTIAKAPRWLMRSSACMKK